MRGCILNKKKDCTAANFGNYKQSDIIKLGAGARILVALINGQPLKRIDLCEKAGVNPSLFGRYRRLLLKEDIIKLTPNGYALYNFICQPTFWDKVKEKCLNAGGPLIDLTLQKLVLGDQHPITGHYETSYDDVIIQGIMIHKGAIELKADASAIVPIYGDYSAFLFTPASILEGDRLLWRDEIYEVKDIEEILDGNKFSFTIAKLIFMFNKCP